MPLCCIDPSENPNAPEYKKGWKEDANFGCACSEAVNAGDEESSTQTVITKTLTRADFAS